MRSLVYLLMISTLSILSSGCSLLEVKLESGIEPLPQEQLSMRVFTREYASTFYAGVEQAADQLAQSDQLEVKSNALMWKISAEQTLGQTIFQVSPVAAMIDTWAFTGQMNAFFNEGNGRQLFGQQTELAAKVSGQLYADFERRMQGLMSAADFAKNQAFIQQYVAANPLYDINFPRVSAFNDWLKFREIGEFEAVTTFGSVPEVMTDMSDRMAMLAAQTPKILGWKAELYALHSNINSEDIQNTLKQLSDTSAKFQQLMAQSPEMMSQLAVDLRTELTPLLSQLDDSVANNLGQLTLERQALERMVERERLALEQMVDRERQALAKEADALVQRTVSQVFAELTTVLKSLILYIVLFLLVVFFAPLGLGVWLGKRIGQRQAQQHQSS